MRPRDRLAAERGEWKGSRTWKDVPPLDPKTVNPRFTVMLERLETIETHMYREYGRLELPEGWNLVIKNLLAIVKSFYREEVWNIEEATDVWPKGQVKNFFAELGGPEILMNLLRVCEDLQKDLGLNDLPDGHELAIPSQLVAFPGDVQSKLRAKNRILEVQAVSLSILYKSCYSTFYVAERLSDQRTSIRLLFDMMRHKNLFEACVCVLEELLAVTDETFNLAEVPNLYELIESLDRTELVSFCRVLSLVIFEPEDKGNIESLKILQPAELLRMRKSLSGSAVKATERNHAVLLGLPHLLRSLVELVSAKPISWISGQWEAANGSVLREGRAPGHRLTIDLILQLVHRTFGIREFVEEGSSDEWLEEFRTMNRILLGGVRGSSENFGFGGVVDVQQQEDFLFQPQISEGNIRCSREEFVTAKHQVQVLFIICSLLGGSRRAEAQELFVLHGLVGALMRLCSMLNWSSEPQVRALPGTTPHGPGCDCNPESALRVQFLRLIHNLFDRDGDIGGIKYAMLSATEKRVMRADWDEHRYRQIFPSRSDAMDRDSDSISIESDLQMDRGLLMMVLDVLIAQPSDASYCVCLASCLEAYLRGGGREEQRLLANGGLLKFLLNEVTLASTGAHNMNSLQTSFDLLGELFKFNRTVFQAMEDEIEQDSTMLGKLLNVATNNLVDSNVFIRAVILSLERFWMEDAERTSQDPSYRGFNFENSRLWTFLETNRHRLMYDLITIIQVEDVNQENICCLNTSLALFMFASAREGLDIVLKHLSRFGNSDQVCENYKRLLGFWKDYYRHRGTDILSLEHSSNVPFALWSSTVDMLHDAL